MVQQPEASTHTLPLLTLIKGCSSFSFFRTRKLQVLPHLCCWFSASRKCGTLTRTDGNPAFIYCNSLRARKWKQLSQRTQRSGEQITTRNSLWFREIYFEGMALGHFGIDIFYDRVLIVDCFSLFVGILTTESICFLLAKHTQKCFNVTLAYFFQSCPFLFLHR